LYLEVADDGYPHISKREIHTRYAYPSFPCAEDFLVALQILSQNSKLLLGGHDKKWKVVDDIKNSGQEKKPISVSPKLSWIKSISAMYV